MWGGSQGRVRDDDGCFSGGRVTLHLLLVIPRPCMGTIRCRQFGWGQGCGDILQTREDKWNTCLFLHNNGATEHIQLGECWQVISLPPKQTRAIMHVTVVGTMPAFRTASAYERLEGSPRSWNKYSSSSIGICQDVMAPW